MSPDANQAGHNEPTRARSATAQGISAIWGLVLDHLVDKHAQAAAEAKVNPEGGVARTSAGRRRDQQGTVPEGAAQRRRQLHQRRIPEADGAKLWRDLPRHGLGSGIRKASPLPRTPRSAASPGKMPSR